MRSGLFGFNLAALALASVPAVMIFESVAQDHALAPSSRETFFVLLLGGVLVCMASLLALTKKRNPNPALAMKILSLAALLLIAATGWAVALFISV